MTVIRHRSFPTPVVELDAIKGASGSALRMSRSRYRTLTERGIVSPGFRVPVRTRAGFSGSRKYHSVLAILALKAQLAGDDEGAEYLGGQARDLESRFEASIAGYLIDHAATDLAHADFFKDLLAATEGALDGWARFREVIFADGEVVEIDDNDVRIIGTTSAGEPIEVLLPATLAHAQQIDVGDAVWVFRILAGTSAIVEIMPTESAEGSGGRRYLEEGAGAPISKAEAEYFQNLPKGTLPAVRVARIAG
ncbi:hypothetical protein ACLM5J_17620 [Nocardioides sp. Bht2]|uniref:hypothetical protein n=1 Tax=Nocardioides sp. Bht2 TaxID=3392297 RepID=UPI0039B61CCB